MSPGTFRDVDYLPQTLVALLIGGGVGALYGWRKRRSQRREPGDHD